LVQFRVADPGNAEVKNMYGEGGPASPYGEPYVEFDFVLDRWQRKLLYSAVGILRPKLRSASVRYAIYVLSETYCSQSVRFLYWDPDDSVRHKPGQPYPMHFDESHAGQVQDAINLAMSRYCDDAGHALAHIAQSYVKFGGWPKLPRSTSSGAQGGPVGGSNFHEV
jgi:hypothetical protein